MTIRSPVAPPTLADVAERAGVSRQTVSNAVNNPDLLRADTLARVQEAIERAGLLAQPGRPQPAHPRLAPDRPAVQPGPGGHGQRRDGPLRALARGDRRRGRLPRAALRGRRGRGRPERVRRPAALHRGRRVRRDRHLPRQPAGGLAAAAAGAVRGVRPAVGRRGRRPPLGRRRRRGRGRPGHHPPARPRPRPDRLDRLAQGLPHRRGPPFGLDPRHARPPTSRPPAWPHGSRTPCRPAGRQRPSCSTRRRPRRSSAPPTPSPWACCTPCATAACTPATTSRSSASTTPRSPRSSRPASPPCASRSRRSPSRSSAPSRACSPPARHLARRAAHADARGPGDRLRRRVVIPGRPGITDVRRRCNPHKGSGTSPKSLS